MRSFSNYLFENMLAFISRAPSVSPWRAHFHLELFINHERGLLRSHGGPAFKCQWRQTGVQLVTAGNAALMGLGVSMLTPDPSYLRF